MTAFASPPLGFKRAPRAARAPLVRLLAAVAAAGACVWLAGCSTPYATRFHTLMAPPLTARTQPTAVSGPGPAWQLLPVGIPAQVDRPQMVVQLADGTLAVVEQERWIAPLNDEVHAAVAERLAELLGVQASSGRSRRDRWQVRIEVQRFDSALGRAVRLDADWRLRSTQTPQRSLRCRTRHERPVEAGYAALAAGHRAAVEALAEVIAERLRELEAGETPGCPTAAALAARAPS